MKKAKFNLCDHLGHKWKPAYIIGEYNGIPVKIIGCYCGRCFFGYDELSKSVKSLTVQKVASFSEEFFTED